MTRSRTRLRHSLAVMTEKTPQVLVATAEAAVSNGGVVVVVVEGFESLLGLFVEVAALVSHLGCKKVQILGLLTLQKIFQDESRKF